MLPWQFDRRQKLETKNILIDERNYENLAIYCILQYMFTASR